MESLWKRDLRIKEYAKLNQDVNTDVLVVGGGIAGMLCAYELKQKGIDVVLAEADRVCFGITQNTTAKITSQHALIYNKILQEYGKEKTAMYYAANERALRRYQKLCADVECDYEIKDSYVYSMDDCNKIEAELRALEQIGHPKEYVRELDIPLEVAGAVKFSNQAQFNPCKFLSAIAKELCIYEHTRVLKLDGTNAICDGGTIRAHKVIIATHFPFINSNFAYGF